MLAEQKFREDLFYRINTVSVEVPPLRSRQDDTLLLATRFLHLYNGEFSRNVRELENRVKRGVIMATGKLIQPEDLDLPYPGDARGGRHGALLRARGNVSAAAESLEVSRPTIHDLMKKHAIDPETYRSPKGT